MRLVDRRSAHREQFRPLAFAELQPAVLLAPCLSPFCHTAQAAEMAR
jgi:hypothetical protein